MTREECCVFHATKNFQGKIFDGFTQQHSNRNNEQRTKLSIHTQQLTQVTFRIINKQQTELNKQRIFLFFFHSLNDEMGQLERKENPKKNSCCC